MKPLESNPRLAGYQDILRPPQEPQREYILNGCTYGDLYRMASGLHGLPQRGENATICICTEDRGLLMAALLSALSGGPRVVLPYALSPRALAEVHASLPVSFLLTDGFEGEELPQGVEIVTSSELSRASTFPLEPRAYDDPFLYLFTGGSTGIPKSWPKTPRNLLAEANFHAETLGITGEDVFLATVPPYHIYGLLFSVLVPFFGSARVLNETFVFPKEIIRSAQQFRTSVLVSVPPHYGALKSSGLESGSIRIALSSAGLLDKADADAFREKSGVDIIEVFGSTETGGIATRRRLRDGESWVPIAPVEWKTAAGRLQVRSDYLSPSLPRNPEGFFLTSDCVSADGSGRFLLRGRTDSIVKVGGNRVDLEEVRAKLKTIPGVRDAAVLAIAAGKGRQNELAALAASHLTAADLKRELGRISEPYAVPKRILIVDDIPVTAAGKYDRSEIEAILNVKKKEG